MAISLSAKKRIRQNAKHRGHNRWRKAQVKEAVKEFDASVKAGNAEKASEQLKICYKKIDQISAQGTVHKNTAARQKSRLAKQLDKIS